MEMFINGAWTASVTGATQPVTDPRSGAQFDTVPQGNAQDADLAIRSAAAAFELWRKTPMADRVRLQKKLAQAMRDAGQTIGTALHRELGRPLPACLQEVNRAADLLDIYAEEGLRLHAAMTSGGPGEKTVVTRDPVGVVVAITPFNYPLNLLMFKLGAALVAGCTVVAKPSADTPTSTLLLAELFHKAGLPKGVFNVVTGAGRAIGEALVNHPVPRKIAFTGGTTAGKAIAAAAVQTMKRVTLELGGQSAAIVCADADIDKAAEAIARHGFANSGQFCYRVNRIYVERPVYEAFLEKLLARVRQFTLAPAGGEGDLGPLVNEKIYANSAVQVDDARAKGARILCGGQRQTGPGFDGGFYYQPTLVADASHEMLVLTEETFGPVLGICPVDDPWQGLKFANDNRYGLAGFVFTRDLARGLTLCEGMEAGSVWLNDIQRSSHYEPFGGVKESGLGREKGRYGVESYLEYKTMYLSYEVPR
ncbi:aldehyde dehydrogenase family protein [Tabrizicola oligotrophica]|uniref:Aldehyde dehydrogenase family protein n=1 Tax=Tabrizicola oligotrophica TaxID=2710650 RepID=A0A6M0QRM1_9RHOB|nr:aldehyde dehydrogenase family protein [Tabrizicola oligotrophica]NEY90135.1 aldehyde dehydrogenase family protein [Tabrizicola oligotrophica]